MKTRLLLFLFLSLLCYSLNAYPSDVSHPASTVGRITSPRVVGGVGSGGLRHALPDALGGQWLVTDRLGPVSGFDGNATDARSEVPEKQVVGVNSPELGVVLTVAQNLAGFNYLGADVLLLHTYIGNKAPVLIHRVQNPPRYGVVVHPDGLYPKASETPEAYSKRIAAEYTLVKKTFNAIRLHFDAKDLLDASGRVSQWGALYARTMLVEAKKLGLYCLVTLPEPNGSLEQTAFVHRWMLDEMAGIFGPSECAAIIRNEPPLFAAGQRDAFTFDLGKLDIAYWDSSGLHAKGYKLFGPTIAGWHFSENPGQELFYSLRFYWDRFLDYRVGMFQRTGVAVVSYSSPMGPDSLAIAKLKIDGIWGLTRTHFTSHPIIIPEGFYRLDLFPNHGKTDFTLGKHSGQLMKYAAQKGFEGSYIYDWQGAQGMAVRNRPEMLRGIREGVR